MSPVVIRNRMRTRSVSRADTSDSSMMKSPLKHQHPGRCQSQVDDDNIMTSRELARTIAEFRVGLSSTSTNDTNEVVDMENYKHTDADEPDQMDTHLVKDASATDQSLITPSPVVKSTNYEPASENPPVNHTQTPDAMPYSLQTTQPDDSGNASSEEPSSRPPTGSHRRGFSSSEKELLEAAFHISDNPGTATMKLLVHLTGLDKKKIRGWFRTRRIRQEREEAKDESSENTPPSVTEPKHQVPPQYWPEPLRFSHMQRPYPVPGHNYRAPPGLTSMASGIPSMSSALPSKVPSGYLYPPLPPLAVPTMGFLPPPPSHWYPPLGFNTGLPPQPSISSAGQLSSGLLSASKATPTTGTPKAPSGPWYPSPNIGHPLQGVIPPSVPTPSGLVPGGFLYPWSSVGCYGAQGVTPQLAQHPSVAPFLSHPAIPYCNPWHPMLPTPNSQNPEDRQIGAQAETSMMNITSTSLTVRPLSSQVTCTRQEVSGAESEASSTA